MGVESNWQPVSASMLARRRQLRPTNVSGGLPLRYYFGQTIEYKHVADRSAKMGRRFTRDCGGTSPNRCQLSRSDAAHVGSPSVVSNLVHQPNNCAIRHRTGMGRHSDIKLGQLQRQLEDVESLMLGIMHGDP